MQTFKRIIKWTLIIVIVYIAVDFANFYILASNYQNIETKSENSNNLSIVIKESKATYVNGYSKITVTNNSETEINNKYILLDGYSEYNNCLVNKYIKIENLKVGETRDIEIKYKAQKVKKVIVYAGDKIQDNYEISDFEVDKPTILIAAIVILYALG